MILLAQHEIWIFAVHLSPPRNTLLFGAKVFVMFWGFYAFVSVILDLPFVIFHMIFDRKFQRSQAILIERVINQ